MKSLSILAVLALSLPCSAQRLRQISEHGLPNADRSSRVEINDCRLDFRQSASTRRTQDYTLEIPQFDPALGELINVELRYEVTYDFYVNFTTDRASLGGRQSTANVNNSWIFTVENYSVPAITDRMHLSRRIASRERGWSHRVENKSLGFELLQIAPGFVSGFVGTGVVPITIAYAGDYSATLGAGSALVYWEQDFHPHVTLTYLYSRYPGGTAVPGLPACGRSTISFEADGATGSYALVEDGQLFDQGYATGTQLALADDGVVDQPIGFDFPMPGGGTVQTIRIDANGRLLDPASNVGSDASPTLAEFLGGASPVIAPMWADLDPGSGGNVWVSNSSHGFAVTWEGVPEAGRQNSNTFQVLLTPAGKIHFYYMNLEVEGAPGLTGVTPGNGAVDPGSSDLSEYQAAPGSTVYEFFSGIPDLNSTPSLGRLVALTPPDRGSDFQVEIRGVYPSAPQGLLFLGPRADFPLGQLLGNLYPDECSMRVLKPLSFDVPVTVNQPLSLPIPMDLALLGVELGMQGAVIDLGITSNLLRLDLTNGMAVRIGR